MPEDIHSLYRTHGPTILRRCRRLLRDERRAVEAMHQVFSHMLADIETNPVAVTAREALILATQTCLEHIRDRGLTPRDRDDETLIRIAALSPGPSKVPSPLRALFTRLLTTRWRRARLIAVLAYLDRLSPEEIAHELALPEPQVRRTLLRLAQRWPGGAGP